MVVLKPSMELGDTGAEVAYKSIINKGKNSPVANPCGHAGGNQAPLPPRPFVIQSSASPAPLRPPRSSLSSELQLQPI